MPPVRWSLSPIYREKPVPFFRKNCYATPLQFGCNWPLRLWIVHKIRSAGRNTRPPTCPLSPPGTARRTVGRRWNGTCSWRPTAPIARGSGRSPGRSGKGHGDASPGLRGRGDRPCWFFLFPYFFGLKNYDFGVIFTPRKGQGVFRHGKRFYMLQNTPCYFLTKIEIRPWRIGVSVER